MDAVDARPDAFGEILRLYQGRVRAYLRRYVYDADLADDLAQETFLAAYRGMSSRNPAAPLDLWLLGIARNRVLTYLRDESRRRARLRSALAAWSAERIEAAGLDRERETEALRDCLRALPPHGAEMIADHYERGRGSAEIARRSGRTDGAVRMTLLRLREALKSCVRLRLSGSAP
jgi:RNA polymerase sigma-70 factor (ECF subfamily)